MKTILILLLIVMVLVSGCIIEDTSCRISINNECDCNIPKDINQWEINFLSQDKCNCCWDTPYLNEDNYYELNRTCIGGDTYYKEYCQG